MYALWQQLIIWFPAIVFGGLFARSCAREPRQFRNSVYLLAFVLWTALMLIVRYGQAWMILPMLLAVALFPVVSVVCLILNGIVVIRRNGLTAVSLLPFALAALIVTLIIALPLSVGLGAPDGVIMLMGLVVAEGMWFSFTLVALMLYSWLYRLFPRRRRYAYIIVHGAGLRGREPSPLLAGRLDKGIELWERQGRTGLIIVSGGKGSDEQISEAAAMHAYLRSHGAPDEVILDEDRSVNTMENLRFSKEIMDARAHGEPYRAAVVTSDFHVFRCAEYAHRLGIAADGVGSRTHGWYWPAAFIREFIAITREHLMPYAIIAALWIAPVAVVSLRSMGA